MSEEPREVARAILPVLVDHEAAAASGPYIAVHVQSVRHCGECPYLSRDPDGFDSDKCDHPKAPQGDELPDDHAPPAWCPLRARPTIVMLMDGGGR